jgi:hypothetical protein
MAEITFSSLSWRSMSTEYMTLSISPLAGFCSICRKSLMRWVSPLSILRWYVIDICFVPALYCSIRRFLSDISRKVRRSLAGRLIIGMQKLPRSSSTVFDLALLQNIFGDTAPAVLCVFA